jgi:hypothetical protein
VTEARLGYPFDPSPDWVQTEYEAGTLSSERRDILLALVHRANVARLRQGKPTPELRIDTLARATHRPTGPASLDALRRLLGRMRRDGQLAYTTRGGRNRVVYVFTLTLERSGVSPGNERLAGPGSTLPQDVYANGVATADGEAQSEKAPTANGGSGPGRPSTSPGNRHPSTPPAKRDSAEAAAAPGPGCSDVQENPSTALTEELASARARENAPDDEALIARLWAETAPHPRGAYWEPDR